MEKTSADDPQELYLRALQAAGDEDYTTAIALLERLLEREPGHADALEVLGLAYERTERIDEAIATARKLTEVAPGMVMGWANLSRFYMLQGRTDEAEQALARSRELTVSEER